MEKLSKEKNLILSFHLHASLTGQSGGFIFSLTYFFKVNTAQFLSTDKDRD